MYMYLYFKKYLSYITTNSLISPILFDEIKIKSSFSYSIYAFIEAYWLTLAFSVHHTYVLAYALHNGYIIVNVKISRHNSFQMIKHLKICKKTQKHKYFFSPLFLPNVVRIWKNWVFAKTNWNKWIWCDGPWIGIIKRCTLSPIFPVKMGGLNALDSR